MSMQPASERGARAIVVDESRRPLILITFRGVATEVELDAYLDAQTRILESRRKIVVVVDAMEAGMVPPMQRKRIAEWMTRYEDLQEAYTMGTAFAIESTILRGALTAILWMAPLANPHHIASCRADAEAWAMSRIAACGLRSPRASGADLGAGDRVRSPGCDGGRV